MGPYSMRSASKENRMDGGSVTNMPLLFDWPRIDEPCNSRVYCEASTISVWR